MSTIEFPFNRDGYRYYLVTKDESAPFKLELYFFFLIQGFSSVETWA